jgi:hypothetical protein
MVAFGSVGAYAQVGAYAKVGACVQVGAYVRVGAYARVGAFAKVGAYASFKKLVWLLFFIVSHFYFDWTRNDTFLDNSVKTTNGLSYLASSAVDPFFTKTIEDRIFNLTFKCGPIILCWVVM